MTDPVDGFDNSEGANWVPRQLTYASDVRAVLPNVTAEVAEYAATTASAYVIAWCTRGLNYDRPPLAARLVARSLAVRLGSNPLQLRSSGAEGQSVTYSLPALTFQEQRLLARWRKASA